MGDGVALVSLDATKSSDDGDIVSYEWLENDGIIATGKITSHEFSIGIHNLTLKITDDEGQIATDEVIITVDS